MDLTSDILSSTFQNKCPRCKTICPLPLVTWIFPLFHFSHPDLLTSADIGCTFPPCMNTAYGWDIFHRSSCCCRSLRKSSSAWRPCFSSASVSTVLCSEHQKVKTNCFTLSQKWTRSTSQKFNCQGCSQNCFSVFTSSSWGSEESKVLWWIASHLHQWTRSTHQLSNDHQLFSEVLPSHPTPGLSPDGEIWL